jgi:hypothetical protein
VTAEPLTPDPRPAPTHDALDVHILRMILYFDVFEHPLSRAELTCLVDPGDRAAVDRACDRLGAAGRIAADSTHVAARGRLHLVGRRRERARAAERLWPWARASAAALARFPWIRGVLVTGGLSKDSVADDADVDFLLLVEPDRVWLAKSGIQVIRRVLPGNARELVCANYLLSTSHLEIAPADRNLYSAIEIATAVPLYGPEACRALLEGNRWVESFIPGFSFWEARADTARPLPPRRLSRAVEALPGQSAADRLARGAWDRYWSRKYAHLAPSELAHRFRTASHVSTNHLNDWQAPVLAKFAERLERNAVRSTE